MLVEAAAVEAVITLSKALLDSVVVWPEHPLELTPLSKLKIYFPDFSCPDGPN